MRAGPSVGAGHSPPGCGSSRPSVRAPCRARNCPDEVRPVRDLKPRVTPLVVIAGIAFVVANAVNAVN
jgi:hypothetical protein